MLGGKDWWCDTFAILTVISCQDLDETSNQCGSKDGGFITVLVDQIPDRGLPSDVLCRSETAESPAGTMSLIISVLVGIMPMVDLHDLSIITILWMTLSMYFYFVDNLAFATTCAPVSTTQAYTKTSAKKRKNDPDPMDIAFLDELKASRPNEDEFEGFGKILSHRLQRWIVAKVH